MWRSALRLAALARAVPVRRCAYTALCSRSMPWVALGAPTIAGAMARNMRLMGTQSMALHVLERKKGKRKGKGGKSKGDEGAPVDLEGNVFAKEERLMEEAIMALEEQFISLQPAQATPGLLDRVMIELPEGTRPLNSLCQVTVSDPRNLLVLLPDPKMSERVLKAIMKADIKDVNPQLVDESKIRVPIPKMSLEYRDSLIKEVGKIAESAKERVRRARRSAMDVVKKIKSSHGEDEAKRREKEAQNLTNKIVDEVKRREKRKIEEIEKI